MLNEIVTTFSKYFSPLCYSVYRLGTKKYVSSSVGGFCCRLVSLEKKTIVLSLAFFLKKYLLMRELSI